MVTHGFFITGTDTGVGKTHVTCHLAKTLIAQGRSVGLYKPVCSGAVNRGHGFWIWEDLERLAETLSPTLPRDWICPQKFRAPLAPPAAAEREGSSVHSGLLRSGLSCWLGQVEVLLVEGVGGWLSPIATGETVADLARDLNFPVLIVAANRLGMINHTLLTLESVKNLQLPVRGIVVNSIQEQDDESCLENVGLLRQMTDVPIWGPLPWCGDRGALPPAGFLPVIHECAGKLLTG